MTRIRSYHRPSTLGDALALLARTDVATAPLAGGTVVNGLPDVVPDEVVDLQALNLDSITRDGATLTVGAMVRLQELIDHEWTPQALRELAHAEAPNTIRNAATVGGTVAAANWESGLLAGLLAFGARATIESPDGSDTIPVADLMFDRRRLHNSLITAIVLELGGTGASARTARTPADIPIVLVAGHRSDSGDVTLAAAGVAPAPVVIDPNDPDALDPPGDFRGTPEYRRHLATVLAARVTADLEGGVA